MKHYKVFKRAWWRKDASGRLVPYPVLATTMRGSFVENGPRSVKAEFTEE